MNTVSFNVNQVQFIGHMIHKLKFDCNNMEDCLEFLQSTFQFDRTYLLNGFQSSTPYTVKFTIPLTNEQKETKQQLKQAKQQAKAYS